MTYWINLHGEAIDFRAKEHPAPLLRKTFCLDILPHHAKLRFASPGWADITINGNPVSKDIMVPTVTQLDKHTGFCEYDVTSLLKTGENVIGAILGNGWFNCATHELWHFDKAPWRNYNRLYLELFADEKLIAVSDRSWKGENSGIFFNQLRSGEYFDAAKDIPGWDLPGFDDSQWQPARLVALPPGLLIKDETPKCRIQEVYAPVKSWSGKDGSTIYDFGKNTTGFVRLTVSGKKGTKITIIYSELIADDGELDRSNIACYIIGGDIAQTDMYIHGDKNDFVWQPRFTYHGFRYVKLQIDGEVSKLDLQACYVYNDFAPNGQMQISHPIAAKLIDCTRNSYVGNFTGIPTDCPHREKNGWLGDATIGCEPGLWMYDGAKNYEHFLQIIADAQRLTGQISGIAPAAGWGYNHYCGPIEDMGFFEIPYQLWQFTGKTDVAEKFYEHMKKNVLYNLSRSVDGIIEYGLPSDWYTASPETACPAEVNSTAIFYNNMRILRQFAAMFAPMDTVWLDEAINKTKTAFIKKYRNADGSDSTGGPTANACAIYYKLDESPDLVARLIGQVRKMEYKSYYGVQAAKLIPRIMAENGCAAEAFKVLTQTDYPGFGYWIKQGATTLWEAWDGRDSQTHIMFGDMVAWYFRYLAGFKITAPGFKKMIIAPQDIPEAGDFKFSYRTAFGEIKAEKVGNTYRYHIPEGIEYTLVIPDSLNAEEM